MICVLLATFLAVCGCRTSVEPAREFADARLKVQQGDLEGALLSADQSYRRYSGKNVEWSWRFRVLKAHILVLRGLNKDALLLLNEKLPPSLNETDLPVRQKMDEGLALDYSQRFDEAEKCFIAAEELAKLKQPQLLGEVALARGTLYVHQHRYAEAREAYQAALVATRAMGDTAQEANALGSLGFLSMWQEHYDEAVDWFKASLVVSEKVGARHSTARTFGNIGWSYYEMGDLENALSYYERADHDSTKTGLTVGRLTWLANIADVYFNQGNFALAEAQYEKTLALARTYEEKSVIAQCLNQLSLLALERGQLDLAEQYNREASQLGPADLEQLLVRGQIAGQKRDFKGAEVSFRRVIQDAKAQTSQQWRGEAYLAESYEAQGKVAEAERAFRRSIDRIENVHSSLHREEFRVSYLSGAIEPYDAYLRFLVSRGRAKDALQLAEHSRAWTLLEGLGVSSAKLTLPLQGFRPETTALRVNAVLLIYWLGPKQSYLWAIPPSGHMALFKLPPESEIAPLVRAYRETLVRDPRDVLETANPNGQKLYEILVAPAERLLAGQQRVVILPDGTLYGLNFETLLVPSPKLHYWIEDVVVTNAASLLLLGKAANRAPLSPAGKLLLIGDTLSPSPEYPALAQARAEIERIETHFASPQRTVLTGSSATPGAYLAVQPAQYAFIHFVAHGTASRLSPLDSAIILTKEGDSFKLYARDLVQHPIRADLVTISSCYGAGTRTFAGEGLVGLSWAFLHAGARNVIGALWEASDLSTPQLMDQLYGALQGGRDPASALRAAKLGLLRSSGVYRKPFYWAAFQLYAGS